MKERPIIFSAPMVRAILEGRKTQTRRVVKHQPIRCTELPFILFPQSKNEAIEQTGFIWPNAKAQILELCPYGQPGDRLWVRESHAEVLLPDIPSGRFIGPRGTSGIPARPEWPSYVIYSADGEMPNVQWQFEGDSQPVRWTPSIHMPRWASRILLEITAVRVERLQDISEADAMAEGIYSKVSGGIATLSTDQREHILLGLHGEHRMVYRELWESINGTGSWKSNPWVWVVEFKRLKGGE